ncbi:restriction endonuclease [Streptomyces sp. NPDC055239]
MTVTSRPVRRMDRERRFDLRGTSLFFALLAIILCVLVFLVRTAANIVESRPLWVGSLVVVGIAGAYLCRSKWRRVSAARYARRAAEALEEATVALAPPVERAEYAALDPDGFERAIADLCVRDDCQEVEVVGGANDLGADVTAITSDGLRVVIQCKRYGDANKVGSQDLQRFGGTCFTVHEADIAALVTTSDFTAPALEYAQQSGIVCVNGEDLDAWLDGTGPSPWEEAGAAA